MISNDIDVALQLQHVCRNNKQVITLSHVHGHQENNTAFRDLPVPSQLNILMDRLSKKMVDDTFNSPNRITPLPAQRLYLIKTTPIVHDVANVLIIGEMERDIYGYYEKHHGVSPKQAKKIDWEALEQGTSSKNATSYKKTLHNFRNTMSINMKWGRIDSDVCPLCVNSPETTIHLLSCPHEDVVAVRQQMISRFKDTMNKLNTAPEICEHWIKILTQYYDGIPISKPPITMNPTTWNIAQAHMTQADIGWDCFFRGMIVIEWSKIQQRHYDKSNKNGENIYRWKRIILQSIMDFIRELWQVRCGYIKAESILTAEQILRQRTKILHDNNVHLKQNIGILDRHLLEKKDSYFCTSSVDTLEIWERKIKEVLKHMDHVPESQPTIAATINTLKRNYIIHDDDNMENASVKRRARFCSNMDPVWHKRLKMSYKYDLVRSKMKRAKKMSVRKKFIQLRTQIRRMHNKCRTRDIGRLTVKFDNIRRSNRLK